MAYPQYRKLKYRPSSQFGVLPDNTGGIVPGSIITILIDPGPGYNDKIIIPTTNTALEPPPYTLIETTRTNWIKQTEVFVPNTEDEHKRLSRECYVYMAELNQILARQDATIEVSATYVEAYPE